MIQACTFSCDITPPVGHPLCAGWYPPAKAIRDRLTALGLVLVPEDQPAVVLCALDWAELSNHEHLRWREALAQAVGTEADRVAVHCTHAHDTPWPDREAQDVLDAAGHREVIMLDGWAEDVRRRVAEAAVHAMAGLQPCTHITTGKARVEQVASNRRVMGEDGRVRWIRWTQTRDAAARAAPEGLIDPWLRTIGFWHEDHKIASLHYYTVHPTSQDGTGEVTCEFVGLARNQRSREDADEATHLYFTGCAGDITAGKYNDGVADNRALFTHRIHDAMVTAERDAVRQPLAELRWAVSPVRLPPREDLDEAALLAKLAQPGLSGAQGSRLALMLTYLRRAQTLPIPITCLHLNEAVAVLHLPGEAFVEYQMHAQQARPDAFVATASYGDLGPGYICMARSFAEGGYEPNDAFVSGKSEPIMKRAIEQVLSGG